LKQKPIWFPRRAENEQKEERTGEEKRNCFKEPTNEPKGLNVIVCKVCNVLYFEILIAF